MADLFYTVFHASLYASVAALVILLLKGVLKQRLNAQWHYLIWAIFVVKLLVPFGPESSFSLFNAMPEISRPATIDMVTPTAPQIDLPNIPQTPIEIGQPENISLSASQSKSVSSLASLLRYLPYIWAAGMLLFLFWLVGTYCLLRLKLKKHSIPAEKPMLQVLMNCKEQMGITKKIPLVVQTAVNTPSLFGIINPRILITPEMAKMTDDDLRYILMHELAHFKRKDLYVNYLLLFLQTMHWFNPLIWYCFKRMRDDMEVATDECVLSVLENTEHRAYGRTLLTMLERFHTPALAPRLLGMVDDKKNIERRIRMIKMADYFRARKTGVLLAGLLCLVLLSGMLLTNGLTANKTDAGIDNNGFQYNAEELLRQRTPYVGDNSKVSNLIGALPLAKYRQSLSLQTKETPYGVTVYYDFELSGLSKEDIDEILYYNAVVMFALIDNVDVIAFNAHGLGEVSYQFLRSELEQDFGKDLREFAENREEFLIFLDSLPKLPSGLKRAVTQAIKEQGAGYYRGEVLTAGHVILGKQSANGTVTVYTLASLGWFGFENDIFTIVSGSSGVPTVMTFSVDDQGQYRLLEYREAQDGGGYADSVREMFPRELWDKVLSPPPYPQLSAQQEAQAAQYLQEQGINAEISMNYVEKSLPEIDVQASNKLFSEMTKANPSLNKYPYWLGTRHIVEDGERFIYETAQAKADDGNDLIIFTKTDINGTVVEEMHYKIINSTPELTSLFNQSWLH
ncbi:M56 family metallopeptidase [Dethiobacter alkaliphilus]|uniref:Peptidase M56 BlaR1 n=1 Tax=Dethiobacter alkaliphilus AHT 1 TaxID=555088 RepID=C0GK87_DETAL|nr:M56 family metallopeptidase [Dethiobacter alkaliphilus]EEG76270.1 peptidase M56 BlaR1 [Dethiobacter alkaliphilus AHT 1]